MKQQAAMVLSPIRLNWHYVSWYRNFAALIVSLVVPFTLLAYWNFNTFSVLLRRRRLKNRPSHLSANGGWSHYEQCPTNSANPTGILPELAVASLNASTVVPHTRTNSTSAQGTCFYHDNYMRNRLNNTNVYKLMFSIHNGILFSLLYQLKLKNPEKHKFCSLLLYSLWCVIYQEQF